MKVSTGTSSANVIAVSTYKFDFGDSSGLAVYGGIFYPCWGDNSNSTGNNPEGANITLDACTAAFIVAPPLNLTHGTAGATLAWPNPSTGVELQESPSVSPGSWTHSTRTVTVTGNLRSVALSPLTGTRLFRLRPP